MSSNYTDNKTNIFFLETKEEKRVKVSSAIPSFVFGIYNWLDIVNITPEYSDKKLPATET